jgi:hypothetical protein
LPTTNLTWPNPGSNPDSHGGKPATNRLSYGAASQEPFFRTKGEKRLQLVSRSLSMSVQGRYGLSPEFWGRLYPAAANLCRSSWDSGFTGASFWSCQTGSPRSTRSRRKFVKIRRHVRLPTCFSLLYKQWQESFTWICCKNVHFFSYWHTFHKSYFYNKMASSPR